MDTKTELAFLERIHRLIDARMQQLEKNLETRRQDDLAMASQIYEEGLAERDNALHELANMNDAMTQNQQLYGAEYRELQALKRLWNSPWFAGIRFRFNGQEDEGELFRIGLMNLSDPDDFTPHVIDWRSPLAGVYYEYGKGRAAYDSPAGRVEGEVTEKKQVIIRHGELLRLFDTETEIQDEILQEILSQAASPHMRNIVATLQQDQNKLIRVSPQTNLLIQGAAGSGKTSIAMHRAAYLLYRDTTLNARQILLLTPNEQLAAYISEVLPDLGEENARQELWIHPLLAELATREGRFASMQLRPASARKRSLAADFRLIDAAARFAEEDEDKIFCPFDIEAGDYIIPASYIQQLYSDNYKGLPPLLRTAEMIDNIRDHVQRTADDRGRNFGPVRGQVESALASMYEPSSLNDLLDRFTAWLGEQPEYSELYRGPENRGDGGFVYDETDITVLTWLKIFYLGSQLEWNVRHLIIDEMQDLPPLAHEVLLRIFPCPRTVLGDMNQAIFFSLPEDYLDKLAALYKKAHPRLETARLLQSYRSTWEITEFSKELLGLDDVLSFERHGDPVEIVRLGGRDGSAADLDSFRSRLKSEMDRLSRPEWHECAVICRDQASLVLLDEVIPERRPVRSTPEGTGSRRAESSGSSGVTESNDGPNWQLLPLAEAKGLEFDAVIIADLEDAAFQAYLDASGLGESNPEQKLIRWYVASTRALHKLLILCQNDGPDFLPDVGLHS